MIKVLLWFISFIPSFPGISHKTWPFHAHKADAASGHIIWLYALVWKVVETRSHLFWGKDPKCQGFKKMHLLLFFFALVCGNLRSFCGFLRAFRGPNSARWARSAQVFLLGTFFLKCKTPTSWGESGWMFDDIVVDKERQPNPNIRNYQWKVAS